LLLPLAITSNHWMMRKLKKNWQKLHKLVYLIGILAVVHFYWLVKSDVREPLIYAGILALLFAIRLKPRLHSWLALKQASTNGKNST
jgi:sulfoxide reductase heme-binding subunit YedZ